MTTTITLTEEQRSLLLEVLDEAVGNAEDNAHDSEGDVAAAFMANERAGMLTALRFSLMTVEEAQAESGTAEEVDDERRVAREVKSFLDGRGGRN